MRLFASCLAIALAFPTSAQLASAPSAQSQDSAGSPELHKLFLEDQAARQRPLTKDEAIALNHQDAERRIVVHEMLDKDSLRTGRDFEEAAFIFQHGATADDYLLAHTLAMIAVSKGRPSALWIATATLDRYLNKVGQPQIFGTQTNRTPTTPWTQEPYNRTLVPDSLLPVLGVDSRAQQQRQVDRLNKAN